MTEPTNNNSSPDANADPTKSPDLQSVLKQLRRSNFKGKKSVAFKLPAITKKLVRALSGELQIDQAATITNALIFFAYAHTSLPRGTLQDLASQVDELAVLVEHQQTQLEAIESLFGEVPASALDGLFGEALQAEFETPLEPLGEEEK